MNKSKIFFVLKNLVNDRNFDKKTLILYISIYSLKFNCFINIVLFIISELFWFKKKDLIENRFNWYVNFLQIIITYVIKKIKWTNLMRIHVQMFKCLTNF